MSALDLHRAALAAAQPKGAPHQFTVKAYDELFANKELLRLVEEKFNTLYVACPTTGCWLWMGSPGRNGYGAFNFQNVRYLAHRLSYTLYREAAPSGLCVCHHCDRPSCVRPEHLFLGTLGDNNRDAYAKGRNKKVRYPRGRKRGMQLAGEGNGRAKLNNADAIQIFESRDRRSVLANRFGISLVAIDRIRGGRAWTHVTGLGAAT